MVEMEVFAKLSYLGSLAYTIPRIKPANLLKYHGLSFVTSSLEKKVKSANNTNAENLECPHKTEDSEKQNEDGYNIAASAASFLQSRGESEDESKTSHQPRNHRCLQNQKLLYAPMGKLLILQPEEKFSPHHHLLPPGSGLYLLGHPLSDSDDSAKFLSAAKSTFLNPPHPLEILSDRSAYGCDGTVNRNHDMNAYLRSILRLIRKSKRECRRLLWSPLASVPIGTEAIIGQRAGLAARRQRRFSLVGVFNGGKETLKRIGRIVALRNVQMFIVFLVPARLLVI